MPRHDLPDGRESDGNVIDFRERLRRRVDLTTQDNDGPEAERSDWETYRYAEYADGTPPRFKWSDVFWLGLVLSIGIMLWVFIRG